MKTAKEPCGCKYTVGEREWWVELCAKHQAEQLERHVRAQAEHREAMRRFREVRPCS